MYEQLTRVIREKVEAEAEVERLKAEIEQHKEHQSDSAVLMDELRAEREDARAEAIEDAANVQPEGYVNEASDDFATAYDTGVDDMRIAIRALVPEQGG